MRVNPERTRLRRHPITDCHSLTRLSVLSHASPGISEHLHHRAFGRRNDTKATKAGIPVRVLPSTAIALLHRFGHHSRRELTRWESERSLIVPCLPCYHQFAAGKPQCTAAAAAKHCGKCRLGALCSVTASSLPYTRYESGLMGFIFALHQIHDICAQEFCICVCIYCAYLPVRD